MNLRQRIRFYQQLAVLTRAGIPLRTSLERLQVKIPVGEITSLSQHIAEGQSIGESFGAAGFSPFETNLVAAGERSAQLATVFDQLAEFWTRELHLFEGLTRRLYYPVIVLHLAIVLGAFLQLINGTIFNVMIVLFTNLTIVYGIGLAFYLFIQFTWRSPAGQAFWFRIPIIGTAVAAAHAYRWIAALRLEYEAGIPIPVAVADAWRSSGYASGDQLAEQADSALRQGDELSTLLPHWRQLPRDWIDFIETGELSGALGTALQNLETEAARAWTLAQQRMTEWLPKIISFVVLLIVGGQIFYMLYEVTIKPISEITNAIGQ